MQSTIGNTYSFIAGHFLPKVPKGHKCARQHGHNYEVEIILTGDVQANGFLIDFYDLDKIILPILERLDHQNLNDIEGLENPTAENISHWFRAQITPHLDPRIALEIVKVWETKNCWASSHIVPLKFPPAP